MEGCEIGIEGQYKVVCYLEEIIKGYGFFGVGFEKIYFQVILFIFECWEIIEMEINGMVKCYFWDYYVYFLKNVDWVEVCVDEVVFLGYGIQLDNYSDYDGQCLGGKMILIFDGEFKNSDGVYYIIGIIELLEWISDIIFKLKVVKENGVEMVIIFDLNFQCNLSSVCKIVFDSWMYMGFSEKLEDYYSNSIYVFIEMVSEILGSVYSKVVKV